MRDHEGRTIDYLRISVTDRCSLRCIYCMPEQGVHKCTHRDILSFEEIAEIAEATARLGVHKIRLTGGEPLVRRGIADLVRMLVRIPDIEEVDMTTNGVLLAPLAEELKEAGLTRLNISLDTLNPERYRTITRTGELRDALSGIAAARAAGFEDTKIDCVLLGGVNDDDWMQVAGLARNDVASVRFIELMPMGECATWPRERFVSADAVLEKLPFLVPAGTDGVAELYSAPGWEGTIGLIRPMTHRFCRGCGRLRLTSGGRLKPCLHAPVEVPLRGLHGKELDEALRRAIALKPEGHHMDIADGHTSESCRPMNEIGG